MTNDEKLRSRATAWGAARIVAFLFLAMLFYGLGLYFKLPAVAIAAFICPFAAGYMFLAHRINYGSVQHGTIYLLEEATAIAVFLRALIAAFR